MPRCLYEVLGVSQDATPDQLRVAYRRLALTWHPDKNQERVEEATAKFTEIQNAYDVLSSGDDRAWYDAHRDSLVRGKDVGGKQQGGNSEGVVERPEEVNLWPYFSPNIFSGFGDSRKGFYRVYSDLFNTLHKQEQEAARKGGHAEIESPPLMGNYYSPWENVAAFYSYWTSFATLKDYSWFDEYVPASAPDDKTKRWMEEENKKIRRRYRKEFEDCVRRLAASVKKRDPRVMERRHLKLSERERESEAAKKEVADHEQGKQKYKVATVAAAAADKEVPRPGMKAKAKDSKSYEPSKASSKEKEREKEDKEFPPLEKGSSNSSASSSFPRLREERSLTSSAAEPAAARTVMDYCSEKSAAAEESSSNKSKKALKKLREKGRALRDEETALRERLRKLLEEEGKVEFPHSFGSSSGGGALGGNKGSVATRIASASVTTNSIQEQQHEQQKVDSPASPPPSPPPPPPSVDARKRGESPLPIPKQQQHDKNPQREPRSKGGEAVLVRNSSRSSSTNCDGSDEAVAAAAAAVTTTTTTTTMTSDSDHQRRNSTSMSTSTSGNSSSQSGQQPPPTNGWEPPTCQTEKESIDDNNNNSTANAGCSKSEAKLASKSAPAAALSQQQHQPQQQKHHGSTDRHNKFSKSVKIVEPEAQGSVSNEKAFLRRTSSSIRTAKGYDVQAPCGPTKDNNSRNPPDKKASEVLRGGGGKGGLAGKATKIVERLGGGGGPSSASEKASSRDPPAVAAATARGQVLHTTVAPSPSLLSKVGPEPHKSSTSSSSSLNIDKGRSTPAGTASGDLGRSASVRAVEVNSMWFQAGTSSHLLPPNLPIDGRIAAAYRLAVEEGKVNPFIKLPLDHPHHQSSKTTK